MTKEKLIKIGGTVFGYAIGIGIILFWCSALGLPQKFFWEKKPGALFEKEHYQAVVYVNVFPSATASKNYRLKALIDREDSCDKSAFLYDTSNDCFRYYNLQSFKWPNGGYEYFDDGCMVDMKLVRIKDVTECSSTNKDSRDYYIQLTDDVVKAY